MHSLLGQRFDFTPGPVGKLTICLVSAINIGIKKNEVKVMSPEQEAAMWFFSTIAQTLGAIVAVVGMLTVYKLDRIGNTQERIFDEIRDIVRLNEDHFEPELRLSDLIDLGPQTWIDNYNSIYSERSLNDELQELDLENVTKQMENAERSRNTIKDRLIMSLTMNLIVIFLAVTGLRFYEFFLKIPFFYHISLIVLFVCLGLTLYLSFALMDKLKKSERNKKKT